MTAQQISGFKTEKIAFYRPMAMGMVSIPTFNGKSTYLPSPLTTNPQKQGLMIPAWLIYWFPLRP